MKGSRVLRHAAVQARVRARLSRQPGEAAWLSILDAGEMDNAIQRMRAGGLSFWVSALPSTPDAAVIESHMLARLGDFLGDWARLLPDDWEAVSVWLGAARELLWLPQVLARSEPDLPLGAGAALHHAAALPMDERRHTLGSGPLGRYLGEHCADWNAWLADFKRARPRTSGREAYVITRIRTAVERHLVQLSRTCDQVLAGGTEVPEDAEWRLRDRLEDELRALLGGDPFHVGLTLIYGMLELIQFERCRAVLLAFAHGWAAPAVLHRAV